MHISVLTIRKSKLKVQFKDGIEDRSETTDNIIEIEKPRMIAGLSICIAGIVSMIIWGVVSIFRPEVSNQISGSSIITIDGNGMFFLGCIVAIIIGARLLLKNQKR